MNVPVPDPVPPLETRSESPRRHLNERQAELVRRLIDAAALEVETNDYEHITVRGIARRAEVAPATAYTYFSSKDHLLAETLWQRMRALPPPLVDMGLPVTERVAGVVRELGLGTADSPALVAACTAALLASAPDVRAVRARIGSEIHRRLVVALGTDAEPGALRVLEITYFGAMLTAGLGHLAFAELPELLADAARLIVEGRR
jgi:AcrR family transcriptional regulator